MLCPWELDRLRLDFSASFSRLGEERISMKASKFTEAQKAHLYGHHEALLGRARRGGFRGHLDVGTELCGEGQEHVADHAFEAAE